MNSIKKTSHAWRSGPVPKIRDWRSLPVEKMTRAEKNMAFSERYLVVPEGEHVGKPVKLAPFQEAFFYAVFDNPVGTRRAILSIARKNSKTVTSAMILLSYICGPEAVENSSVASGALSRDQAALVFTHMSKFIGLSPQLSEVTRIVPSKKMIIGLAKNVTYQALAKDGGRTMGRSDIVILGDEWGQIKGPTDDFVDALISSQGAYGDKALQIVISTQASSDADMLSQWIDDAERSNDQKIVCHIYAADENCDLLDKTQWKKANPALGIFRSEKDLEDQLTQAARLPSMEASSRNLLLNQRIALESIWLAPSVWKANNGPIDMDVFRNNPVCMGLDLSMRTDLTAAVLAAKDSDGVVHLKPYIFAPAKGIEERAARDRAPYMDWVRDGHMIAVPGSTVDYDYVSQYLRDELDDNGINVDTICFDRWRISLFQKACEDSGAFPSVFWVPVGQGFRDMSPRLESFEAKLLATQIRHGGHPLLNLAASHAIATMDSAGGRKLDKSKASQRIDPLVAAVMALHQVSEGEDAEMPEDLGYWVA